MRVDPPTQAIVSSQVFTPLLTGRTWRITNPSNGKAVVAVALDYGPSCSIERGVDFPVLDTSGRINRYLFGSDQGASDRSMVHVVEVDASTPLGPLP